MADRDDDELPPDEPERQDDIVRRHLTRAWQSWAPAPDLDARVRARLTSSSAATLGAMGLGAASGAGRPSPWASLQATGKLGALVGIGLAGAGFLSGYVAHSRLSPRSEPPAAAAPHADVAPTPAAVRFEAVRFDEPRSTERAAPIEPEPVPVPVPAQRSGERAARATPPRAAATAPNEELALLQRAERAVRADNAALALALIGELEARYPHSTLLEERSAIELLAHCRAGASDADARAARFLRQHPSSLYAGRVRELCPSERAEAVTNRASPAHRSEQKEPR